MQIHNPDIVNKIENELEHTSNMDKELGSFEDKYQKDIEVLKDNKYFQKLNDDLNTEIKKADNIYEKSKSLVEKRNKEIGNYNGPIKLDRLIRN